MDPSYKTSQRRVAVIAWDGMDLTDFVGPIEALSHATDANEKKYFPMTVVAAQEMTSTSQDISIPRHITVAEAVENISDYDVLVIPGGRGFEADRMPKAPGVDEMIEAFMNLPERPGRPRCAMSVCSGSCFFARAGLLEGKIVTSHPIVLPELQAYCDGKYGKGNTKVVRQHYVNGGVTENGTVLITTGGITSGFDGALYLIEIACGIDVAERSRWIMDTAWRKESLPFGFAA